MTTTKPTRQQVVEAIEADGYSAGPIAQRIADILVRAGIAEEPREEGYYWVKRTGKGIWFPAVYWRGDDEWRDVDGDRLLPAIIGPRILPPQE